VIGNLKQILNKRAVALDGKYLGKLEDLSIDDETKDIKMLRIELQKKVAKELGVEVKLLSTPGVWISRGDVKALEDVLLLNSEVSHLKNYVDEERYTAETPPTGVAVKQFLQKEVVTEDGIIIGEVADAVLDTKRWVIISLTLKADRKKLEELCLSRTLSSSRVDIDAKYVESFGERYVTLNRDSKRIVRVMARPKPTQVRK